MYLSFADVRFFLLMSVNYIILKVVPSLDRENTFITKECPSMNFLCDES